MAQIKERCENCRFWERVCNDGGNEYGICHRMPPIAVSSDNGISTEWPETEASSFCGEWQLDLKFPSDR